MAEKTQGGPGEKFVRSEEEARDLKDKIVFLSRVFSKTYDMKVVPGQGWGCSLEKEAERALSDFMSGKKQSLEDFDPQIFKPKTIVYPEEHLRTWTTERIMGVLRHEVGHANNSDYRVLFKGQKQAQEEGYMPSAWASVYNSLEDPWINNIEMAGSEAVRRNMNALYEQTLPEVVGKINQQPQLHQLGLNMNHYWFTGEGIPGLKDREVLRIFEEIKPSMEKYFVGKSAEENYQTLQNEIWDKVKPLVAKSLTDQEKKRLMESLAGEGFDESEGIGEKIREALSGEGRLDRELGQAVPGDVKKGLVGEFKKQKAEKERQEKEKGELGEGKGEEKIDPDIDLTKIPEKLQKDLEEALAKMPRDLRDKLRNEARKRLDEKLAKSVKDKLPPSINIQKKRENEDFEMVLENPDRNKTEAKEKEVQKMVQEAEKEEARQEEKEAERNERERQKFEAERETRNLEEKMKQEGFDSGDKAAFAKYKELESAMRGQIANFVRVIEKYLPKREEINYGGEFYTGPKVDWNKVPRRVPVGHYDIFKRREAISSPEAKMYVWLLIDRSGSMQGTKMKESLKTAIFFARVLRTFDVPLSITFFGDHLDKLMTFEDNYDNPVAKIKPKLVALSDASGSSTDLGAGLKKVEKEMVETKRKFPGSMGSVFVISDGDANTGVTGQALYDMINKMQKDLLVYGFDLSGGGSVAAYFGEVYGVSVRSFTDLPNEAFRALRISLERMARQRGAAI